jgi:hypothetical protein
MRHLDSRDNRVTYSGSQGPPVLVSIRAAVQRFLRLELFLQARFQMPVACFVSTAAIGLPGSTSHRPSIPSPASNSVQGARSACRVAQSWTPWDTRPYTENPCPAKTRLRSFPTHNAGSPYREDLSFRSYTDCRAREIPFRGNCTSAEPTTAPRDEGLRCVHPRNRHRRIASRARRHSRGPRAFFQVRGGVKSRMSADRMKTWVTDV